MASAYFKQQNPELIGSRQQLSKLESRWHHRSRWYRPSRLGEAHIDTELFGHRHHHHFRGVHVSHKKKLVLLGAGGLAYYLLTKGDQGGSNSYEQTTSSSPSVDSRSDSNTAGEVQSNSTVRGNGYDEVPPSYEESMSYAAKPEDAETPANGFTYARK